ncbi:MAG: PQQ-binding-like beta-propeller repeat protein, partial [Planctomycetes bacterium]|nr:PQQ-binding-like beta-propeller repeat protein [Planctomycetota bacterium]
MDDAPAASTQLPADWSLVARDAFNGVLLWEKPVPSWAWHLRKFRSGPVQLPRTLVAEGDRVYVPLGVSEPVSILDAKTGDFVAYCQDTDAAEEIIVDNGILFVVAGSPGSEQTPEVSSNSKEIYTFENTKSIVAVNADTGKKLWKWTAPNGQIMPLTLAAQDGRVIFNEGTKLICLNAKTGKRLWSHVPDGFKTPPNRKPGWSVHTMVVHDSVVLWADGKLLRAISAKDGKPLWQSELRQGFNSPPDVFVIGGLVWTGSSFAEARDLTTGKIVKTNSILAQLRTAGHHHRCYREKATERYILSNHRGIEFLDLQSGDHSRNNWIRGLCQYGIMPSNGLIYAPPHSCGCFMEAKLYGFWALAPQRD